MKYKSYKEYLAHQKEKTFNPEKRKKWLGQEWEIKLNGFKKVFGRYKNILKTCKKALCLGARTGQEVQALCDMGIDAIGIDLVPCEPLVMEGDIHNIPFSNESFAFVFSNVFDHALYPDKFISEIERVLKCRGYSLLQFQIEIQQDEYTEKIIKKSTEAIQLFKHSKVVIDKKIPQNFAAMNWEILMRKKWKCNSLK